LVEFAFKPPPEWEATFSAIAARHADALQVLIDYAVVDQAERIAALALAQRLPTFSASSDISHHDRILLTYGPSIFDLYRRSAYYVKRVLAGTESSDLPAEQATQIKLVINLRTAQTLGLDVPPQLLARADEVLE
jgi:putative tryptophan/tyrosine transport system substrate-binding protein